MTTREIILLVTALVLLVLVMYLTFWGCKCARTPVKEKFENPSKLTAKEEELFQDIRTGKLDDAEIQKLVEGGKITEKMVEKFLANLDLGNTKDDAEEPAAKPAKKPTPKPTPKPAPKKETKEVDEGFEIEGFCNKDDKYAPAM